MTITGENFSEGEDTNNVFIGSDMNAFCSIKSVTQTEIVCQVPRMHESYSSGDILDVVVTGRIIEESVCEGICTFSYQSSNTLFLKTPGLLVYE